MTDIFDAGYDSWASIGFQQYDRYLNVSSPSYFRDGILVHSTSASISRSTTVPTLEAYYNPYAGSSDAQTESNSESDSSDSSDCPHGKIRIGSGLFTFSGEISFELTNGLLDFVLNERLFKRSTLFCVQFYSNGRSCTAYNCVWSSISISCKPSDMVSVSISFQSNNAYQENLLIGNDYRSGQYYDDSDLFVPYWRTGRPGFEEFTLSFSRNVSPVFLNNDFKTPTYIKPSATETSLQATMVEYIGDAGSQIGIGEAPLDIIVGRKRIRLNNAVLNSLSYNMSSMSDVGKRTYTWDSIMETSGRRIFSIFDEPIL